METIVVTIRDVNAGDRHVLENVLGRSLGDNQQLIVQMRDVEQSQPEPQTIDTSGAQLPDWCNVYAGLSDEEIAEVEKIVLTRADLTRAFE